MKKQNPTMRCAFTILEMLLVIVLIGLLVGAAGGIYIGTYKNKLVEKSARDFFLAAKYARILAIERQNRCIVKLDKANNRLMLVIDEFNEDTGQTEQIIVKDLYFKPIEFSGEVKFEKIQIGPNDSQQLFEVEQSNTITFSPDGTAQTALIQIGDGKNHLTVSISAVTGRSKVYSGTADNVKSDTIDLDEERG